MDVRERGAALGFVIAIAALFAIAVFAALVMALSARQHSTEFYEQRLRARYAAESGIVWAMQRLWADPTECFPGPGDFTVPDPDGAGPLAPIDVQISVPPPCTPATVNKTLKATVTY